MEAASQDKGPFSSKVTNEKALKECHKVSNICKSREEGALKKRHHTSDTLSTPALSRCLRLNDIIMHASLFHSIIWRHSKFRHQPITYCRKACHRLLIIIRKELYMIITIINVNLFKSTFQSNHSLLIQ